MQHHRKSLPEQSGSTRDFHLTERFTRVGPDTLASYEVLSAGHALQLARWASVAATFCSRATMTVQAASARSSRSSGIRLNCSGWRLGILQLRRRTATCVAYRREAEV